MRALAFIIVITVLILLWPHLFPPPKTELPPAGPITSAEVDYHTQVFDYAMDNTAPGGSYVWKTYNANGYIQLIDSPFVSKSGSTCRKYEELITVLSRSGKTVGIGCKRRGEEGWCRLRTDQAYTCAMEKPYNWFDIAGPNFTTPNMPNVNVGNMNVNTAMPNVNTNMDIHAPGRGYGVDPADTITGAAGSVAGPATTNLKNWFSNAFSK